MIIASVGRWVGGRWVSGSVVDWSVVGVSVVCGFNKTLYKGLSLKQIKSNFLEKENSLQFK